MWCPECVSGWCVYCILKSGLSISAGPGADARSSIGPSPAGRTVDGSRSRRRTGRRDDTDPCVCLALLPASDCQDCVVQRHNTLVAPVMRFVATSRPLPAPGRDGTVNEPVEDSFRAPHSKRVHLWDALCLNRLRCDSIFLLVCSLTYGVSNSWVFRFPDAKFWLGSRREPAPLCFVLGTNI